MSVRTDLEDKLILWAKAQSPVLKVALEGRAFDKPTDGSMFLQSFIMPAKSVNADVGGKRSEKMESGRSIFGNWMGVVLVERSN